MDKIKLKYWTNSTNSNEELARTFDIWYFFMEVLSNVMFVKWKIKNHPSKLNKKDLMRLLSLNQILRNNIFSITDRYLLETYKQSKIENIFNTILYNIDFDLIEKDPNILENMLFIRKSWIPVNNKSKIENYYTSILERLRWELNNLNFSEKIINEIFKKLEVTSNLPDLLLDVYKNLAQINKKIDVTSEEWVSCLSWVVRELQALDSYKTILFGDKITNRLFFQLIDSRDYYELNVPKDNEKEDFFNLILDSHTELDNLIETYYIEKEKYINAIKGIYRELNIDDSLILTGPSKDLKSILHHLLDWYAKIAPWGINKKDPKKIAVIIYIIYEHIKKVFIKNDIYINQEISNEFLAKFWWRKWQSSISQLHYTHFGNFLEYFEWDITLMFSSDLKLPKKWKKIWQDKWGYIEKNVL